jgi:hypothetical protein
VARQPPHGARLADQAVRGNSDELRRKLQLLIAPALRASRALWAHPKLAQLFPEYLFTTHCIIRASVPLMELARDRCERLAPADPVAAPLARYLAKHIPEERNHDQWLLDDLEVLGFARHELLARIPPVPAAELAGCQYYWILHHHPLALLGYIAVLEGYPPSVARLEDVMARTRLPRAAFQTLLKHAHLDRRHRTDLDRALDALPLTRDEIALLGVSALTTVHLLARAIEDIVAGGDGPAPASRLTPTRTARPASAPARAAPRRPAGRRRARGSSVA